MSKNYVIDNLLSKLAPEISFILKNKVTVSYYSIKDLEELSGFKTHTIRTWEKRYNIFTPVRTKTNIRRYSDEDLKMILRIQVLDRLGIKISKIVSLSTDEIDNLIDSQINCSFPSENTDVTYVNEIINTAIFFDEVAFSRIMEKLMLNYSLSEVYQKIFYQVLVKVGLLWGKGKVSPAQEHFLSNLIRGVIISQTNKLPLGNNSKFILFLPEKEEHEIALLFANFLFRLNKIKVIYLGQRVPFNALQLLLESEKPEAILSMVTIKKNLKYYDEIVNLIDSKYPDLKSYWAGPVFYKHKEKGNSANKFFISSLEELSECLKTYIK
jgi:MerR family transcriptional regulator, light-induced transcriptional regulator